MSLGLEGLAGERWRVLRTWRGEPGWNMALDEALLASAAPAPVLRFYTWEPAALSLGYFQRWRDLEARAAGCVVVRRFSGGGAIHHADELTFALAAPATHALFRGEVRHSYERVHALLAQALARHGVAARLRGTSAVSSDRAATGMCFHESTDLDLVWDGAKGVGSAQRRTGGRVLHHGSIKLGRTTLEEGVAVVRAHDERVDAADLATEIAACFERELGVTLVVDEPTPKELERAAARASFYRSSEWVRRR
jgi:lipoate-protein ligase A